MMLRNRAAFSRSIPAAVLGGFDRLIEWEMPAAFVQRFYFLKY